MDDEFENDDVITQYTYTPAPSNPGDLPEGLLLTETDPLERITLYDYVLTAGVTFGKLASITYAWNTDDEAVVQYEYDSFGYRSAVIDPAERRTEYEYDEYGRLRKTTGPAPDLSTPGAETEQEYVDGRLHLRIDANGNQTQYEYDDRGRLWKTFQADPVTGLASTTDFTVNEYDPNGNLITVTDQLGRVTRYEYDELNRLVRQIAPDPEGDPEVEGPVTTYTYYPSGKVKTVTDPMNNVTEYVYDIMGRLVKTILPDPDGEGSLESPVLESVYDAAGQLEFSIDALGVSTKYVYDELGRLTKTIYADDEGAISEESPFTLTTYDKVGNVITFADARGSVTTYEYDNRNRRTAEILPDPSGGSGPGPTTTFEYCICGVLTSTVNPHGITTTYGYDGAARLISTTVTSDDELLSYTTSVTYDANGNVLTRTDALGSVTLYEYDGLNRLIKTTRPNPIDGTPTGPATETFYDAASQVTGTKDARGYITNYEYDGLGRLIETRLPDPDGAGPLDRPTTYLVYDDNGNVISRMDPMENIVWFTYDNLNRQISTWFADGENPGVTTYTAYNAAGQVTSTTDALNNVTSYEYDSRGRLKRMILPSPDGIQDNPTVEMTYDENGNLLTQTLNGAIRTTHVYDRLNRRIETIHPDPEDGLDEGASESWTYNDAGQVLSWTDTMARVTSYDYDGLGRRVLVTLPDPDGGGTLLASTTATEYDDNGNVRFVTDALNQTTEYQYDKLNRLVKVIQPPAVTLGPTSETSYAYDASGNRTSLVDPNGNETTWEYDPLGRMVRETDPLLNDRLFAYDQNNRLTQTTDRLGRIVQYDYDYLGRRIEERWYDPGLTPTLARTLTWGYDDAGRLTSASDPEASYVYIYDDLGRMTSVVTTLNGLSESVTLENEYDLLGNRTQVAATIGTTADFLNTYVYDALQRLTQLKQFGALVGNEVAEKFVAYSYNAAGQMTSLTRHRDLAGTQVVGASTYMYDQAGRLTQIAHPAHGSNHSWTYDVANRITQHVNSINGTVNYTYDHQNQLTSYSGGGLGSSTVGFDQAGNRSSGSYVVEDGNQITGDGSQSYTYDDEGNLARRVIGVNWLADYVYDHRNRLIAVLYRTGPTDPVVFGVYYGYDVFNRKVTRSLDWDGDETLDESEFYVYDDDDVVLDFYDADGDGLSEQPQLAKRYLHGTAVDQVLAQEDLTQDVEDAARVLWFLHDNLNSTRDLLDNDGDSALHANYTPWGVPMFVDFPTRYLFTGREYDTYTELQYNRNRWYDPLQGRWMSRDPIGFEAGDANLYRYVGNGPTYAVDPTGLAEVTLDADAFIPSAWVSIPPDPWQAFQWGTAVSSFVKGDDRGVSNTPSRGARTRVWSYLTLDTCSLDNWHVKIASGHGINSSTRKDVISPWYTSRTWTEFTTGTGTLNAEESGWKSSYNTVMGSVNASGRVPFRVAALPVAINYEYTLRLTQIDKFVFYTLYGTHDAFPGHEVYISYNGNVIDKHLFTPTANGWLSSPLALAGWGSVNVYLMGVFEVNQECACI